jgi:hypothetical protein
MSSSFHHQRHWIVGALLLLATSCRPIGASVVTPVPVPVATSYVAPLATGVPTPQQTVAPTPQPEDDTSVPSIITVEPPSEGATATPE